MFLVVEKILKHLDLHSLENAAKVSYEWGQAILIETKNYLRYSLVKYLIKSLSKIITLFITVWK